MRLLYDAVLPRSLAEDAPQDVEFVRWTGDASGDTKLVHEAIRRSCRAVVLFERDSLQQPELRRAASAAGVALVAVEARDPIEAKHRLITNMTALRRKLADHDCLLVLAGEVRPMDPLSESHPES